MVRNPSTGQTAETAFDVLAFDVQRPHNTQDHVIVKLQRRLGVESADLEYLGTIIAACYLLVSGDSAWQGIATPIVDLGARHLDG